MITKTLRAYMLLTALALLIFSMSAAAVFAQDEEDEGQPVLEKGIPTLKYRRGDGYVMKIQLVTLNSEPALSCPSMGIIGNRPRFGDLVVSKTKVVFHPYDDKNQQYAFDVSRGDVSLFQYGKHSEWNGGISVFGGNKDTEIRLQFQAASYRQGKKQLFYPMIMRKDDKDGYLGEGQNFIMLAQAYADFDQALGKFQHLTAGLVPSGASPTASQVATSTSVQVGGDAVKQGLWERFINNRKTNPDVAYQAAKAYVQMYPNDADENAQLIKKWSAAYEKVKSGTPQP